MAIKQEQIDEIEQLRGQSCQTVRPTVPAMEELLYKALPILDHGFIRVVDYMGDDRAIVQAARVSYGTGTKLVNQDQGLINYLMRHRHTTPFEMCEIKFHIKLPIFVAREWIRHRTANVNEYSGRYSIMNKEFYIPEPNQIAAQSTINNQGRGESLPAAQAQEILQMLRDDSVQAYNHYQEMMNADEAGNVLDENKVGLARELARMNLTLNYYTEWYWKIDLHNLLHFVGLRADSHAQYEIRVYAQAILDILAKWVPFAHDAYMRYHFHGAHLSQQGLDAVRRMIAGEKVEQENSGMSAREWRELLGVLGESA